MRNKLAAALLGVAAMVPGTARAEWQVAQSKHFVVYDDDSPARVKGFTERLERFDKAMRVWHVSPEDKRGPSARVTVFVVGNIETVQKIYGKGGDEIGGFYHASAGDSVAFTPRSSGSASDYGFTAQAVLFHEYTHHWMLTNDQWSDAAFPPWFIEGFAEMHATAVVRPDGSVTFGASPAYRRYTVGNDNLLPAKVLLRPNPGKLTGEEREALYSRGWLLVSYLFSTPERRKQLADYIVALNSGKSADEASRALGNPNQLDLAMNAFGAQRMLPATSFTADQLPIGEVTVRALNPAEAAIMPALIASKRGVDKNSAPRVVALARAAAAPFPHDGLAQNELAEAEFDNCATDPKAPPGCFAAAAAAADRAIAADPRSVHALVYRGMADEEAARRAKVTDPARWAAIRHWFLAANKLDPEAPQPLIRFYESFGNAGQTPSRNAEGGLLYAYALAPYDVEVRMDAARVLLGQGNVPAARTALAPVAYSIDDSSHNGPLKVLEALDTGGAAAGLKELDAQRKAAEDAATDQGKKS